MSIDVKDADAKDGWEFDAEPKHAVTIADFLGHAGNINIISKGIRGAEVEFCSSSLLRMVLGVQWLSVSTWATVDDLARPDSMQLLLTAAIDHGSRR